MALHQTSSLEELRSFIHDGGAVLWVLGDDGWERIGVVLDLEHDGDVMAWIHSGNSSTEASRVAEVRVRDDEEEEDQYFEAELESNPPLVLIFTRPKFPEDLQDMDSWRENLQRKRFPEVHQEVIEQTKKEPREEGEPQKYYFCYWARLMGELGFYPMGVVVASGARLHFEPIDEAGALEADSWNRSHTNSVSGDPVQDLSDLSASGQLTSFSNPEPISSMSFQDAVYGALDRAKKARKRVDKSAEENYLVA